MGNLPCCGANEKSKPNALLSNRNPSNSLLHNINTSTNINNNINNIINNSSFAGGGGAGDISSPYGHLQSSITPPPNNQNPSDKFQLEEQQRALHQEQERLARIVNDANQHMVPLTGTGSGGRPGGQPSSRGVGYYDANYAAEVWQDLIPGRNNGGGLIARCQTFAKKEDPSSSSTGEKDMDGSSLGYKKVPRGGLESVNVVDSLAQQQEESVMMWNDEEVRLLNELIVGDGSGSGTVALRTKEGMDMLVDDLAERFLATVFQERGFQGAPIVENVL
jgi:hypothetical protein